MNLYEATPPNQIEAVSKEILSSKHFELIVAECDGNLVGTCYLNLIPNLSRVGRPYAVIENVVVTSNLRSRGIGKALLKYALARAWERGCYKGHAADGFQVRSEAPLLPFLRLLANGQGGLCRATDIARRS